MKKAFGLLTTVIITMLIATLLGFIMTLSQRGATQNMDDYLASQAKLLAYSATEIALLSIASNSSPTSRCVQEMNLDYANLFDINISIDYIGSSLPVQCINANIENTLVDSDLNGTVIIDTYVHTKADAGVTNKVSYFKRSVQKP
jgi:hypothetical protein